MLVKSIKILYKVIMIAQSVMWIVFAIVLLTTKQSSTHPIVTALMIANGVVFFAFLLLAETKNVFLRILTLAFLAINLVLSFTDQIGLFDYVAMALNILAILCFSYLLKHHQKKKLLDKE